MFEIRKPEEKPIKVIRNATLQELFNYEKWKLENINKGTQLSQLEAIKTETPIKKETFASIKNN